MFLPCGDVRPDEHKCSSKNERQQIKKRRGKVHALLCRKHHDVEARKTSESFSNPSVPGPANNDYQVDGVLDKIPKTFTSPHHTPFWQRLQHVFGKKEKNEKNHSNCKQRIFCRIALHPNPPPQGRGWWFGVQTDF